MKKTVSIFFIFVFSMSCVKGPDLTPNNCDNLSDDYLSKVTAFSNSPSKSSCEALVKSLDNLVKKCTLLTTVEKKQYQDSLAQIDCSDF